ncbi:MAG: helix-turn-helix domain-containing protein [Saccharofermentanales bacterium]
MQDKNLIMMSGGYHQCTPAWNEDPQRKGNCYKLYFPVEGSGRICVDGIWYELMAGNAYFINGFLLDKQRCDDFMNIYWLHFVPESQYLGMYLNNLKPVFLWAKDDPILPSIDFTKIPFLFDDSNSPDSTMAAIPSLSISCYINSVILLLISDMMHRQPSEFKEYYYSLYTRLSPAIDYISNNYRNEIRLEDISSQTFLNPVYFSRLFKKCFKMTPVQYMNRIRLNEACRLLTQTGQSILEISENTGFCNQFYFSKVFRHHFRKTPTEYRNTKFSP